MYADALWNNQWRHSLWFGVHLKWKLLKYCSAHLSLSDDRVFTEWLTFWSCWQGTLLCEAEQNVTWMERGISEDEGMNDFGSMDRVIWLARWKERILDSDLMLTAGFHLTWNTPNTHRYTVPDLKTLLEIHLLTNLKWALIHKRPHGNICDSTYHPIKLTPDDALFMQQTSSLEIFIIGKHSISSMSHPSHTFL